jgi:hypothetical protein
MKPIAMRLLGEPRGVCPKAEEGTTSGVPNTAAAAAVCFRKERREDLPRSGKHLVFTDHLAE